MPSDEALVERIRAGDERAFDVLYARYAERLFGFCMRALGVREDAEEVFHEAMLRAIRSDGARFERGGFAAYVYQIARNLCLNRRRAEGRARRAVLSAPEPDPPASADRAFEEAERLRALDRAVARLPDALSELYALRASGLSLEEIAGVLAEPVGTIKSRMFRMVRLLQEQVNEEAKEWTARGSTKA